jgi:RHS repeat-associated protein
LTSTTTGNRTSHITYDTQGNIASIVTADGKILNYAYDSMNRIKTQTLPDSSMIGYKYDADGNMTVLTNPKRVNYGFDYTKVNLRKTMATILSGNYQYVYDKERNLKSLTFPSGKKIVNTYASGLLKTMTASEVITNFTYGCSSLLAGVTKGSDKVTYGYDGTLLISDTRSGLLNQFIGYSYNKEFQVTLLNYAGTSQPFIYDNDGLLINAGSFTINRNIQNGLPESISDGTFINTRTFSGYGELDRNSYSIKGNSKYSYDLTRDLTGRITQKSETIDGVTSTYAYVYDTNGRLTQIKRNNIPLETYTYDTNGNRLTENNTLRNVNRSYTFSTEDQILTAGSETYEFDADGYLTRKTSGANVFTYQYSSNGELLSATLPGGNFITYDHDPLGRRISKRINGNITEKYLWKDAITLLAIYDGNNNLIMRFTYADGRMPVSMTYNGNIYYLAYDQVGSLKTVTDTSGNTLKMIDYDSFGSIISETNQTMKIPFGFAGGLHDRETGIVRFGARDYAPDLGRWTAKDPIDFAGGDMNLYGYVANDPINFGDSMGLWGEDVHSGIGNSSYGTYTWAQQLGFSSQQATWIAEGNNGTDGGFAGFLPILGEQSRHFNQLNPWMNGYQDSRDYWAFLELMRAVKYYKKGNCRVAYSYLGRGLHSIQDKFAHRDWNTGMSGWGRHPDWYDIWSDPKNELARKLTENASINYIHLFQMLTGQK